MDYAVGKTIKFHGYTEPVEAPLLVDGGFYVIQEVVEAEEKLIVECDNPEYNAAKKASATNAKTVLTDIFFDEAEVYVVVPVEMVKPSRRAAKVVTEPVAAPTAAPVAAPPEEALSKPRGSKAQKVTDIVVQPAQPEPTTRTAKKGLAVPVASNDDDTDLEALPPLQHEDATILAMVGAVDDILELADELVTQGNSLDYKLGGVLYHVSQTKAHRTLDPRYHQKGGKGVKSGFELYLGEKLGLGYRKAMHLIEIYYRSNEAGLDGAWVSRVGWTKAAKVAAIMTRDNAEDLIKLAEENTVTDLTDVIKESYVSVGGAKGEQKRKVTFKFRLFEDSAVMVQEILERAGQALGMEDLNQVFEHILAEWAMEKNFVDKESTEEQAEATQVATPIKSTKKAHAQVAAH